MNKKIISSKQHGFTIVELMVVIGIIGILSSIAIPLYSDYMQRAKVAEAAQLLGGLRIPMQEFYGTMGSWPHVDSIQGRSQGTYVSIITSGGTSPIFYIEATMRGDKTYPGAFGKQLRMIFNKDENVWTCSTQNTVDPIPTAYLPSPCKDVN